MLNNYKKTEINDDMIIWRYMPLNFFIDLLKKKALYLRRVDLFRKLDPYEGKRSQFHTAVEQEIKDMIVNINKTNGIDMRILKRISKFIFYMFDTEARCSYVNCWHINEFESLAMWELYAKKYPSVAIKTTIGKLRQSLKNCETLKIDAVTYVEKLIDDIDIVFRKHSAYCYENELRIVRKIENKFEIDEKNSFEKNIESLNNRVEYTYEEVDITKLIDAIYIKPKTKEADILKIKTQIEREYKKSEIIEIPPIIVSNALDYELYDIDKIKLRDMIPKFGDNESKIDVFFDDEGTIIGRAPAGCGTKAEKENNILQISNLEFNYYWNEIGIEHCKVDCNKRVIVRRKAGDPLPNTKTFVAIRQQNSDGDYVETEYIENQNR